MMGTQMTNSKAQSSSMREYIEDLVRSGVQVLPNGSETFWTRYESGAMMRRPTFHLVPPTSSEVRNVLWRGRAAMASYLIEPDGRHPANAWLYVCTDQSYSLDKLPPVMRRNVRRGLKELVIAPLPFEQLLANGAQAFCDTRRRNGLNDGTLEDFHRCFAANASLPEHVFLGAWKNDQLAAFLSITQVDDWAEIGCFSADALLQYRPNDTLIYSTLSHYLVERKYRLVSYGLSSIQAESNVLGLHRFKIKVGFEARPVHRAFVLHPLLRPIANRLTLWGVNTALQFSPGDRRLKKIGGVLRNILENTSTLEVVETSTI